MTNYGDTSYGIMIATAESSGLPSGDILYLLSPEIGGSEAFTSKITDLPSGVSFGLKDGRRAITLSVADCYIIKYTGVSTNTDAFSEINNWLRVQHGDGKDPLYFFAKNLVDNKYIKLGIDTSGTAINYLKGYVQGYSWVLGAGNVYHLRGLRFKECLS